VGFLTTDNHANFFNDVFIDRFTDPEPVAHDTVTGPTATNTLQREIVNQFGPPSFNPSACDKRSPVQRSPPDAERPGASS
jgi:hypothetical protein